jgi:hypothetical protein
MTRPAWRASGARIRLGSVGWTDRSRLTTVTLENATVRCTMTPSRGTDIIEFLDKRADRDWVSFAARGPMGTVEGLASSQASFLDGYSGGWQLILPNGGDPSEYRGAVLGQHAEAALLAWDTEIVEDEAAVVEVVFRTDLVRFPLHVERRVRLAANRSCLEIAEIVTNTGGVDLDVMWGEHLAFGAPILMGGVSVELPSSARLVSDEGEGDAPNLDVIDAEVPLSGISYYEMPEGWYRLRRNAGGSLRVGWDATVQPYLWLWREFAQSTDFPFWGSHVALGLEPFAGMPTRGLEKAVSNGTALKLAAGVAKRTTWSVLIEE